jgi:16S rRNA (adenine1518-N6/adenine1519-N6)-dimethyltransferase
VNTSRIPFSKCFPLLAQLRPSKRLGQNFLFDPLLLEKIAKCALPLISKTVIEIGPGPCGLTKAIVDFCSPDRLICIEKDKSFMTLHNDFLQNYSNKVEIIYDDALNIRPQALANHSLTIIANLPYSISTKLLSKWLLDLQGIDKMVLMFQKEVAERIVAKCGTKSYGRLSVFSQLLCKSESLFDISNKAFYPSPKVTSTIVKLVPQNTFFPARDIEKLQKLIALCFQQRRKMLHSILRKRYKSTVIQAALQRCEIAGTDRPEIITPEQFLQLSQELDRFR